MANQRLEAIVHGLVQGVSFRWYTRREAARLGLTGRVANLRDGTVHVVAEGPRERLDALYRWLHQGSPSARVERVEARWGGASGEFEGFELWW